MSEIADSRIYAKVGDILYYNLLDEYRRGFADGWNSGEITKIARKYLTIGGRHEFNIEHGYHRPHGDFTVPGIACGSKDRKIIEARQSLRKLGAMVESCKDWDKVRSIAEIMDFEL